MLQYNDFRYILMHQSPTHIRCLPWFIFCIKKWWTKYTLVNKVRESKTDRKRERKKKCWQQTSICLQFNNDHETVNVHWLLTLEKQQSYKKMMRLPRNWVNAWLTILRFYKKKYFLSFLCEARSKNSSILNIDIFTCVVFVPREFIDQTNHIDWGHWMW